ncbi:cell division cycle protein 27 homolog B [Hevea brasiliensis]|uniref:cell division cycle protein 27 homolog B n=1 Tax=Hevea brasiliensis TaxID=3981 RepID=UPI0025D1C1D9|nr:cell division cycle protein 27 homolog B [Hevea brasiliensis]
MRGKEPNDAQKPHLSLRTPALNSPPSCEAEFVNLQLLGRCYLNNNQAYRAYHILKGTETAQSRYLFAMSCFQMDLLSEAEAVLLPAREPDAEVPEGAAGHYLLGLIYRYTSRNEKSVKHLRKALFIYLLFWPAYKELCTLGQCKEYICH